MNDYKDMIKREKVNYVELFTQKKTNKQNKKHKHKRGGMKGKGE